MLLEGIDWRAPLRPAERGDECLGSRSVVMRVLFFMKDISLALPTHDHGDDPST